MHFHNGKYSLALSKSSLRGGTSFWGPELTDEGGYLPLDPGSQKPFMWNGNNLIAYSDPSGFKDTRPDVYFKTEAVVGRVTFSVTVTLVQGSRFMSTMADIPFKWDQSRVTRMADMSWARS